jgi:hypothetical protein
LLLTVTCLLLKIRPVFFTREYFSSPSWLILSYLIFSSLHLFDSNAYIKANDKRFKFLMTQTRIFRCDDHSATHLEHWMSFW